MAVISPHEAWAQDDWQQVAEDFNSDGLPDEAELMDDGPSSDVPSPEAGPDESPSGDAVHTGRDDRVWVRAGLTLFPGRMEQPAFGTARGVALMPDVNAGYQFRDRLQFYAGWHLLTVATMEFSDVMGGSVDTDALSFGNPYLGARFRAGDMWIGAELYIPLTDASPLSRFLGMAMQGRELWSWLPDHLVTLATGQWTADLSPEFRLDLEVKAGLAFSFEDSDETSFALETRVEVSYRQLELFTPFVGMTWSYAEPLFLDATEASQVFANLGGHIELEPFTYGMNLSLPLDDPLGFAFSADGAFGLQVFARWQP